MTSIIAEARVLCDQYIVPGDHARSDYFGLVRELVARRNLFVAGAPSRLAWQDEIDRVYALLDDELRTNRGRPAAPVKFGTSGWRGILGKDLFVKSVARVTRAIIRLYESLDEEGPDSELAAALGVGSLEEAQRRGCVVGFDNRFGGELLAGRVMDMLTAHGFRVHYAGESTTGVLSAAVLGRGAAFSINLTPSHNPLEYGGFKYNAADGGPAAPILTDRITGYARAIIDADDPGDGEPGSAGGAASLIEPFDALAEWQKLVRGHRDEHGLDYDLMVERFHRAKDVVVAVDCVHGASRNHIRSLFGDLASDRLIMLRDRPDFTFGGIAPEPSAANLQPVVETLRQRPEPLKIGVIIDPDGDRIRFTDSRRDLGMNSFGALAYHFLHEVKGRAGMVAKTVATSNFANCLAAAFGEEVFESRVGFKEFKPVFGRALVCFEESDGISIIGHTPEKDAYIGLFLALDMVLTMQKNLGDYLGEIETRYGAYFPAVDSVRVTRAGEELGRSLAALEKYRPGSRLTVGGIPRTIVSVIDIDGRKMILEDGGWIMIRPSGTEPKVRFYVEARSEAAKKDLLDAARRILAEIGLL